MKQITLALLTALLGISIANAEIIPFHIARGTMGGAWNSAATMVVAKMGDTVRIFNDDSVDHILHTFGAPCPHGDVFAPGTTWDCVISQAFDPMQNGGPLYDHNYGPSAEFWIRAQ